MTALEVQWEMLRCAQRYAERHGLACVDEAVGRDVLDRWERVLEGLETDRTQVANWVDWVAKERLINGYAERHGVAPGDTRLRALDLQYHDMRADRGLAGRLGFEKLVADDDATSAMTDPPTTTRAYFRGRCLQKWPDEVVAANWDSMVFDVGREPLRRVPMMEPLRGTAQHVSSVIDESRTAAELLARLANEER